jgi:periplasmic glucans biosynthesis protein
MTPSDIANERDARLIPVPPAQPAAQRGLRRYWVLLLAITMSCVAGAAATRPGSAAKATVRYKFDASTVIEMARRAATSEFVPRKLDGTPALQQLNYDQYRDIRFNADAGIWRNEQVPFRVEVLPAGFLFQSPVKVSTVEDGFATDIVGEPSMFSLGPHVEKLLANQTLALSGFRLRNRINSRSVWDEFAVFQGASYFRAVGRGEGYGMSARGLAIRTAHPMGEEFPLFSQFWIDRPAANASSVTVYALLDSQSTTGAYRFTITPGLETVMDVDVTLFPRAALDDIGIAPLTSMFLFDESERTRIDDFRDEVHDSDGLLMVLASGERVWRPLRNPTKLQVSSFTSEAPKAFGLIQRSRRASDYQDLEAHYELRPSVWIEPTSQWGAGAVQLVEIPSNSETNDNIVAFWRPHDTLPAGKPYHQSYRLRWTTQPKLTPALAKASSTRSGPSFDGKRRIFVVEFTGTGGREIEGLKLDAGTSAGKLSNLLLQPNPLTKGVRASFELDPGSADVVELRLRLLRSDPSGNAGGDRPVSETWLYRWTAS